MTIQPNTAQRLFPRMPTLSRFGPQKLFTLAAGAIVCLSAVASAAPAPAATRNVLAAANGGKVISATSQADDHYWKPENLIDGLLATKESHGWAAKSFAGDAAIDYPQEIVLKCGGDKPRLLTKVVLDTKTVDWPLLGRGAKDVELQVSAGTEEGPWVHVARHSLLNKPGPQTISFKPTEAKFVKVQIASNWGSDRHVSLGEVEAYEAIMGTGELDELISRLEQILMDLKRYRDEAGE